jgi:two-component system cell cycle sensor histidine kinase/response regulator CckA
MHASTESTSVVGRRTLRVLFVEDCEPDIQLSRCILREAGYEVEHDSVFTAAAFAEALRTRDYDVVLCDYRLPGWTGTEVLNLVRESGKELPVVVVTGTLGEETAVEMIKLGAADFVLKDRLSRLPSAIQRALRERQIREECKRAEEQLRQAVKMEAVGRLAGGVAHDFNNLLNIIIGYSDLMMERRAPEFVEKSLREIRNAADRAARLTRQLLAFSRQQVLEPKVLDLNEVVADMEELLHRMIGEDVELLVLPAQSLGLVRADPGQVGQVIMNLAGNSRDAMPGGGRLTVETTNVTFDENSANQHPDIKPGAYVLLAVSDTGCGMDARTQSLIFEPFFTTKEKGTGLGLATVYGIVKQSGGFVSVNSNPGQGTTFKIYLPRVEGDRPEPHPAMAVPEASCAGSETLLVVEDEEGVRNMVGDYLRMQGYTVLEAENGEAALRVAGERAGEIALMITDVVMPGMSGHDLALRLEAVEPSIRVLYISGYAQKSVYQYGVLAAGAAFLQKPFGPAELGRKVRKLLDGRKNRN